MGLGNVVNQFQHVHGLAHTGTTEQADLATLREWHQQINNLDTGFKKILTAGLFIIGRCLTVNRPVLGCVNRADFILRYTQHVHDAAKRCLANRYRNGLAGCFHHQTTLQAF